MKKYVIGFLCLFISTGILLAQEDVVEQFDLTGILNGSFDLKFAEDADSNVWLVHSFVGAGIETGLARYNGESWENMPFICSTCIRDITTNSDGSRLIVAADLEGVFEYSEGSWVEISPLPAWNIAFTSAGQIRVVNGDGVFELMEPGNMEGNNTGKPSYFSFAGFEIDQNEDLWMLKNMTLYQNTPSGGWTHRDESFNPVLIEMAPDGKLWTAENTGKMSYFDADGYHFNQIKNVFPSGVRATAIHIDRDNTFWVGVQGSEPGMTKYNETETVKYKSEDLVGSSNPIDYIFSTRSGEIWAFENYTNVLAHVYESQVSEPADLDQDGYNADVDCNDEDPNINPGAEEIANNDIDENCDGEMLVIDNDQDGFNSDEDCNDEDASINPGAEEIANNDIDENCDGEMFVIDNDQDGFNSDEDCNDEDATINPDAEEIANNDIDENCDGEMLVIDNDQDGFNSDDDCNDEDATINPGAEEIANNDIDENCDGEMLVIDNDQDGFNSDDDCNDEDATINPDAEEIANNGIDEDCDGADLTSSLYDYNEIKINISPNPSRGNSRISFSEKLSNPQITIRSISGQVANKFDCSRAIQYFDINTTNFSEGIYIVHVVSGRNLITEKLYVEK